MQFNMGHQSPCSVPPPDVVVVVLGLRALRDSIKCCIGCLPERDLPERRRKKGDSLGFLQFFLGEGSGGGGGGGLLI